ncbi:MAG: hypothetical protein K6F05_05845 [Succinivibrio sp.]|nr:hypothetical protein [Succinivibrio sp.]
MLIPKLLAFLGALILPLGTALAQQGENCTLAYRPQTNEVAFAAVGSVLKVADRTCEQNYLLIPFDQKAVAVTIPEGEYAPVGKTSGGALLFALTNTQGYKVESCALCDPLRFFETHGEDNEYLCVISKLNIRSCAAPEQLSYSVVKKKAVEENVCTPGLIYAGREADLLKFEVTDCRKHGASHPLLTYDLRLGTVMRYKDERFEVLSADNEGIYFRRLPQSPRRPYEFSQSSAR